MVRKSSVGVGVLRRNLNLFQILLCSILITGTPYGSMGAEKSPLPPTLKGINIGNNPLPVPVPVTPPGNDGLLPGMTPGNYKIPSGWSLIAKQDFEGSLSGSEGTDGNITTTEKHTGSKSVGGVYAGDGAQVSWWLNSDAIGSFSEIYVSWFEYTESQARFNDEYWLAQFLKRGPGGELYQEVIVDWMWAPSFNSIDSYLYVVPQSAAGGGMTTNMGGTRKTVPTGSWVQWEIHYRPNTSGNSDGFLRIYKDGTLWQASENKNLNGSVNMSNMSITVGGIYTKLTWMSGASCSSFLGDGQDDGPRVTNFSNPYCPNQSPPEGKVPIFKRYFDDIIVLKK